MGRFFETHLGTKNRTANIVLAIVGLTVVSSTFVFLLDICANVGQTVFKCPNIANMQTVGRKFNGPLNSRCHL
jgi:hypothetical protein